MFSRFRTCFFNVGWKCRQVNKRSSEGEQRVAVVNTECPDCICEQHKMSKHSPGFVSDEEKLTRFVFDPVHLKRNGGIKPSIFSHVSTYGCSIQRESIVLDNELIQFLRNFLNKNPRQSWHGILTGECSSLRKVLVDSSGQRALCIYDTAEEDNPAHAEIHQSQYVVDEAGPAELRAKLFEIFNNGENTTPSEYRSGTVLAKLQ